MTEPERSRIEELLYSKMRKSPYLTYGAVTSHNSPWVSTAYKPTPPSPAPFDYAGESETQHLCSDPRSCGREDVHGPRVDRRWLAGLMTKWDERIAQKNQTSLFGDPGFQPLDIPMLSTGGILPKVVSIEFDHIPLETWNILTGQTKEETMQDICQPDHEKPTDPGVKSPAEITNVDQELRLLRLAVSTLDEVVSVCGKEAGERVTAYLASRYMVTYDD